MSLYCPTCRVFVKQGESNCPKCFRSSGLACVECNHYVEDGASRCSRDHEVQALVPTTVESVVEGEVVLSLQSPAVSAALSVPAAVASARPVPSVYEAGRHGVKAEVRVPEGDVTIMNELLSLVQLLHAMAARANQFRGHTEHTRKMIRDMRVLATDVQDEVEMRRGPLG